MEPADSHSPLSSHETEAQLRAVKVYAETVVDTVRDPLVVLDPELRVRSANTSFYATFQERPEETEGRLLAELGDGQWDIPQLATLLATVLSQNRVLESFEVEHEFKHIGRRTMLLNARRLNQMQLILLAIEDVTERRQAWLVEMRQRLIQNREEERGRLARELHDGPIQELVALAFELTVFANRVENACERDHLAAVETKLERTIRHLRQITLNLRPPEVVGFGLAAAIQRCVDEYHQQQPVPALEVEIAEEVPSLPEEKILALYRICQQALFNVMQHAKAQHVRVRLQVESSQLVLEIEDNGRGFAMPDDWGEFTRQRHLGIVGMSERADVLGGHLNIHSAPGQGTQVRVVVPHPEPSATALDRVDR